MSGQRQKNRPRQEELAFPAESRSEAPTTIGKGTETLVAKRKSESLAGTERLMEEVCGLENSRQALQQVKANKGSPGADGMTVEQLPEYLKQHGPEIGEQLRSGTYQPQPVRRVEIQKPDGSGVQRREAEQTNTNISVRWEPDGIFAQHRRSTTTFSLPNSLAHPARSQRRSDLTTPLIFARAASIISSARIIALLIVNEFALN